MLPENISSPTPPPPPQERVSIIKKIPYLISPNQYKAPRIIAASTFSHNGLFNRILAISFFPAKKSKAHKK